MQPKTLQRLHTHNKEQMGRSRYTITEADKPHFMTCTVMEWLPVFTRPETVQILLDCWQYQRQHAGLKLYGYVVLENHLHFIAQSSDLNKSISRFKSYTARKIIDYTKHEALSVYHTLQHCVCWKRVDTLFKIKLISIKIPLSFQ
jgi:REP element-mobilizing transposase RayT